MTLSINRFSLLKQTQYRHQRTSLGTSGYLLCLSAVIILENMLPEIKKDGLPSYMRNLSIR